MNNSNCLETGLVRFGNIRFGNIRFRNVLDTSHCFIQKWSRLENPEIRESKFGQIRISDVRFSNIYCVCKSALTFFRFYSIARKRESCRQMALYKIKLYIAMFVSGSIYFFSFLLESASQIFLIDNL